MTERCNIFCTSLQRVLFCLCFCLVFTAVLIATVGKVLVVSVCIRQFKRNSWINFLTGFDINVKFDIIDKDSDREETPSDENLITDNI
jgi:hypothetical protein